MRQYRLLKWASHAILMVVMAQSLAAHKPIVIEVNTPNDVEISYVFDQQSKGSQSGHLKSGVQAFPVAADAFAALVFESVGHSKFSIVVRYDGSIGTLLGAACHFGQIKVSPCPHFNVVDDGDKLRLPLYLSLEGQDVPAQPKPPAKPPETPDKPDTPDQDQSDAGQHADENPSNDDASKAPTVTPAVGSDGDPSDKDQKDVDGADDEGASKAPTVTPTAHDASEASDRDLQRQEEASGMRAAGATTKESPSGSEDA